MNNCPICKLNISNYSASGDNHKITCPRCTYFEISENALIDLKQNSLNELQIANISKYINENKDNLIITSEILEELRKLPILTVGEKADKLLKILFELFPVPGKTFSSIDFGYETDELLRITSTFDISELSYLLLEYLIKEKKYIEQISGSTYKITPHGWSYREELRKRDIDSNVAFVALWVNKKTDLLWEKGIKPAVYYAGYEPYRVDKDRKVEKIDNEIFVKILESNFVISDFTGQRPNVYYEAGFAKGLGKKVIWTCKEREIKLKRVGFDIRQYSFLTWEDSSLNEFSEKLYYTILEFVGRGKQYKESSTDPQNPFLDKI